MMHAKPAQMDFTLQNSRLKMFRYTEPSRIPLRYTLDGVEYHGVDDALSPTVTEKRTDSGVREIIVTGSHPSGLRVRVECLEYSDYPVTEWLAFFTNTGAEDSGMLTDIRIGTGIIEGASPVLYHGNGDTGNEEGYAWFTDPVTEPMQVSPHTTLSCCGAFPYMRLLTEDASVNLAIGWSGCWTASFQPCSGGVDVSFGQSRCHMKLHPGETVRTPRITMMISAGGEDRSRNMWRRWYMQYILPHPDGKPLSPKLCMHLYQQDGFSEFTGATEEKQILAMQTYLQNGVHPDVWWMDAGWYVNRDHNWCDLGTWKADPARFPHGLKPIGDFCRANDMEFLLWFEPERASRGSEIFEQHPEWMLFWNDSPNPEQGMPFLGDPACLSFLLERINAILKESGVCVYRQDYNHGADIRFWEYNEPQDRVGALENLHVQGYYRLWDGILAANPGLWIDSCAGGGRRNDLETMRRSVPLHYTDVGYGNHPVKQKQHRQMFEWIPYFRAHNMAWDDADGVYHRDGANVHGYDEFSYQAAMAPALTSMLDYRAGEAEYAMARKMHPVWRQAAELMLRGDYWPLSECRKSPEDYYAMCFFDPDAGDGFVQILRNTQAEADVFSVRLSMLETDAVYQFINPVNGETFSMDLSQTDELTVRLEKRSAVLYMFSRVQ